MPTVEMSSEDTISTAMEKARSLFGTVSEGRDFHLTPIIYFVGWVFVAYLLIYFLAVYVGPALFGTAPWGRPYYARNIPFPHRFVGHNAYGRSNAMADPAMTDLTGRVARAISRK